MITLLQTTIFLVYVAVILKTYGLLESISESTYKLSYRYWFTITLWALAMLNYFQPMEMFGALTSAGLFFTGATVSFKSTLSHQHIVHYVGAGSAILFALVGLWALHGIWYPLLGSLLAILLLRKHSKRVFLIEVISFLFIMSGYFFIN